MSGSLDIINLVKIPHIFLGVFSVALVGFASGFTYNAVWGKYFQSFIIFKYFSFKFFSFPFISRHFFQCVTCSFLCLLRLKVTYLDTKNVQGSRKEQILCLKGAGLDLAGRVVWRSSKTWMQPWMRNSCLSKAITIQNLRQGWTCTRVYAFEKQNCRSSASAIIFCIHFLLFPLPQVSTPEHRHR